MTTYIAFLRAINVGGRFVKMERLRAIFEELGFANVRSVIQSGNIAFDATESEDRAQITRRIEESLAGVLGYDVAAMVRTIGEVETIIATDPFRDIVVAPDTRLCVLFISEPLPKSVQLPLSSKRGDLEMLAATDGEVFVVLRQAEGRPGNPTLYLEKAYGLKATARFYGAVIKILNLVKT